jgi:hypothetical protein
MGYNREAYELLEAAFKVLKTKKNEPYAYMVGLLLPNVNLKDARRIAEMILAMDGETDTKMS